MDGIIIFFLFHWWAMRIFYKITDFDKPNSILRDKIESDLLYKLCSCKLCMESHIGFILSIPIIIWTILYLNKTGYSLENFAYVCHYFVIGYISAGLSNILNMFIND